MKASLWNSVISVRKNAPLVHHLTNYVVMNTTANATLAIGASPVMAHARDEVAEMVALCSATVINTGTPDPYWIQSMLLAAAKASELGKPWILDPVGAGASVYRNETAAALLACKPAVVRGNASEIMSLAAFSHQKSRGVDSRDSSDAALPAALHLNEVSGSVICISGATDLIVSGKQLIRIQNGHPLMRQVTGLGCTATALIAAFTGNAPQAPALAAAAAMALLGIAGEIAAEKSEGPGSLQLHVLDKLYSITQDEFYKYLRIASV